MKVAIYGQEYQETALEYVVELLEELQKNQAVVLFESQFYQFLGGDKALGQYSTFTSDKGLDSTFDLFVSFGGDGTILRAITYIKDVGIPVVGVNTGRLGFLSTFKKEVVRRVVTEFNAGAYELGERSLVADYSDYEIPDFGSLNFALTEVSVSRKDTTSMITIATYLNDEYLTSYWADGLIIATPTGSTGYSLSCGGPVITPTAQSLVITPIAPHNLNARPLVISDTKTISMEIEGRDHDYLLSIDSKIYTVPGETKNQVKKADYYIILINLKADNFYNTLRQKLLWGEDTRNHK